MKLRNALTLTILAMAGVLVCAQFSGENRVPFEEVMASLGDAGGFSSGGADPARKTAVERKRRADEGDDAPGPIADEDRNEGVGAEASSENEAPGAGVSVEDVLREVEEDAMRAVDEAEEALAELPAPAPAPEARPEPARPDFPWPPPQPSAVVPLPVPMDAADAAAVSDRIETALAAVGYHERSWWTAPGGFALATRLERIDNDGAPADEADRWPPATLEDRFTLSGYLASLFFTEPGYFRVIVFVLSDQFEQTAPEEPSAAMAADWVARGMVRLPADLGAAALTPAHSLTALVYEFERAPDSDAVVLAPGRLSGRAHLDKAALLTALAPE